MAGPTLVTDQGPAPQLAQLLEKVLRITTTDQRQFIGRFTCVDKECNIILNSAEEFRPPPRTLDEMRIRKNRERWYPRSHRGPGEEGWAQYVNPPQEFLAVEGQEVEDLVIEGRILGLILIPGKIVEKIELIEEKHKASTHVM